MRTIAGDVERGVRRERENEGLIFALTGCVWRSTEELEEYCVMDFYNDDGEERIFCEQKSCEHDYDTKKRIVKCSVRKGIGGDGFVIGANKIKSYLERDNPEEVIILMFEDQTRYVPYDQELFLNMYDNRQPFQRKDRNTGEIVVDRRKIECFIPFDKMILAPYRPDGTPMTKKEIDNANGEVGCLILDD